MDWNRRRGEMCEQEANAPRVAFHIDIVIVTFSLRRFCLPRRLRRLRRLRSSVQFHYRWPRRRAESCAVSTFFFLLRSKQTPRRANASESQRGRPLAAPDGTHAYHILSEPQEMRQKRFRTKASGKKRRKRTEKKVKSSSGFLFG